MLKRSLAAAVAATLSAITTPGPAAAGKAVLNIVLVLDGLRPDSISASETPNLWRLREEGVNFLNGHSVFPTVTRVNATAIGTGTYPDRNGMLGNTIYIRQVDPNHAFGKGTADWLNGVETRKDVADVPLLEIGNWQPDQMVK